MHLKKIQMKNKKKKWDNVQQLLFGWLFSLLNYFHIFFLLKAHKSLSEITFYFHPHFARLERYFLDINFLNQWIKEVLSCDFFCGAISKASCMPRDLLGLKERICTACSDIKEEMLQNVGEIYVQRWLKGRYLKELV